MLEQLFLSENQKQNKRHFVTNTVYFIDNMLYSTMVAREPGTGRPNPQIIKCMPHRNFVLLVV